MVDSGIEVSGLSVEETEDKELLLENSSESNVVKRVVRGKTPVKGKHSPSRKRKVISAVVGWLDWEFILLVLVVASFVFTIYFVWCLGPVLYKRVFTKAVKGAEKFIENHSHMVSLIVITIVIVGFVKISTWCCLGNDDLEDTEDDEDVSVPVRVTVSKSKGRMNRCNPVNTETKTKLEKTVSAEVDDDHSIQECTLTEATDVFGRRRSVQGNTPLPNTTNVRGTEAIDVFGRRRSVPENSPLPNNSSHMGTEAIDVLGRRRSVPENSHLSNIASHEKTEAIDVLGRRRSVQENSPLSNIASNEQTEAIDVLGRRRSVYENLPLPNIPDHRQTEAIDVLGRRRSVCENPPLANIPDHRETEAIDVFGRRRSVQETVPLTSTQAFGVDNVVSTPITRTMGSSNGAALQSLVDTPRPVECHAGSFASTPRMALGVPPPLDYSPLGSGRVEHDTRDKVELKRVFMGTARDKEDWCDFQQHFELLAETNGWSDGYKAKRLMLALKLDAEAFAHGLPKEYTRDYETLSAKLTERFGPFSQRETYLAEAQMRTRRDNENFRVLGQDIEQLCRRAFPGETQSSQTMAKKIFIENCGDVHMRNHVRLSRPKDLNEAEEAASYYEKIVLGLEGQSQNSSQGRKVRRGQANAVTSGNDNGQSRNPRGKGGKGRPKGNSSPNKNDGQRDNQSDKERDNSCFICGKMGHWRNDCPNRDKGGQNKGNNARGNKGNSTTANAAGSKDGSSNEQENTQGN